MPSAEDNGDLHSARRRSHIQTCRFGTSTTGYETTRGVSYMCGVLARRVMMCARVRCMHHSHATIHVAFAGTMYVPASEWLRELPANKSQPVMVAGAHRDGWPHRAWDALGAGCYSLRVNDM